MIADHGLARKLPRSRVFSLTVCVLFAVGCASHRVSSRAPSSPPAVVVASVRVALPNDYLRLSFLPPGIQVTTLSRPGALRAFATATSLYTPPFALVDLPNYSGLVNDDQKILVAMRCRPAHPENVDAVLATWPNVFSAIQRDLPLRPGACKAEPVDVATQMACFAQGFSDPTSTAVSTSMANTFSYAGVLFDGKHAALAQWLQINYGISPAFAGTGYSIKDSYSLTSQPMTAEQILENSISSEYILKNVSLAEAGCRCISVAPYQGRSNDRVDPDFITKAGGDGGCNPVSRLQVLRRR
jgi:hypothetical protein